MGDRFDPIFDPGCILKNDEDALDVNELWDVGLGIVVESLDAPRKPDQRGWGFWMGE